VTALLLCGGNTFPFAIGAVVDGASCDFHTPLSGDFSPVLPVVPIGTLLIFDFPVAGVAQAAIGGLKAS
jgi:hypothetical protein